MTIRPELSLIHNVRPWGAAPADIHIAAGRISAITPSSAAAVEPSADVIDGAGLLALPGFVNAHAHIDKSWWGMPWVGYAGEPTTQGRIAHERAERDRLGIPSVAATTAVLREFIRTGTTAIRTHIDVDLGLGLRGLDVVREALAAMNGTVHAQVVAFPQDGVLRRPGVVRLLDEAARAGADYIGGIDPASIDRDPVGQLDALFDIAERRDVGIDIHLHDPGPLGAFQIELIIDRTRRTGLHGRVNVAHGFALGDLDQPRQAELITAMAEAGVSMTTVAPVGRAPLPLEALLAAELPVGLGTDGIRDLWSPYGTGDLLQLTTQLARLSGLRHDHELTTAARIATSKAAGFVGREEHDLTVGAPADIVLVDAENVPDAVVRAPARAIVVAAGELAARDGAALTTG